MNLFKQLGRTQKISLLFFILLFGGAGTLLISMAFAAISNPVGFADFCYLEGSNTVIYGWAHDDEAPAGASPSVNVRLGTGQSVTVPTDRSGYRDAPINEALSAAGWQPSSVYGFRAVFSGVYKGSSPTISGTILNYGPGNNINLDINDFRVVDGNPNYFIGKKVPDACLATKPATSAPTPTPQPTPRPTPRPSPAPTPAEPAPLSADANATVTSGTLAISLAVPAGNAALVKLTFGTSDGNFTELSAETPVQGANAVVTLTGLQPKSQYYYQIHRFNADRTATAVSPTAAFNTLGFDLQFTLTNQSTPLKQQEISLNYQGFRGTTDEKGVITIKEVPAGSYTLAFTYEGKDYQKDVAVSSTSSELVDKDAPTVAVFRTPVNVAELTPLTTNQPQETAPEGKSSRLPLVLLIVFLLLSGGTAFWFIRRRSHSSGKISDNSIDLFVPPVGTLSTRPPDTPNQPPSQPNPGHVGESLKDMVLKSMQEEAARKTKETPNKEP